MFLALERMKADLEMEVDRLKKTVAEDMQQPLIDIEAERDALRQKVCTNSQKIFFVISCVKIHIHIGK